VNGLTDKTFTVDQATRIRLVGWIIFDDLTVQDTIEDFIKGKMVCLCFLISVVSDMNAMVTDGINDRLNIHKMTLPNRFWLLFVEQCTEIAKGWPTDASQNARTFKQADPPPMAARRTAISTDSKHFRRTSTCPFPVFRSLHTNRQTLPSVPASWSSPATRYQLGRDGRAESVCSLSLGQIYPQIVDRHVRQEISSP
jgi:hypothetical protein